HPLFEPLVREAQHLGGVADQRLVVQRLEDLLVGHAAPSSRRRWPGWPVPCSRCPSAPESDRACSATTAPTSGTRLVVSRTVGPDTDSAATTRPPAATT